MHTEITPASSEARAPKITRERMSRPASSVPSQCNAFGGLRTSDQLLRRRIVGRDQRREGRDGDEQRDHRKAHQRALAAHQAAQRAARRALDRGGITRERRVESDVSHGVRPAAAD